jgi:hypothetical protein
MGLACLPVIPGLSALPCASGTGGLAPSGKSTLDLLLVSNGDGAVSQTPHRFLSHLLSNEQHTLILPILPIFLPYRESAIIRYGLGLSWLHHARS